MKAKLMLLLLFGSTLYFLHCSKGPDIAGHSGGASDQGNAFSSVHGCVLHSDNTPATGVDIWIRPSSFLSDTSQASNQGTQTGIRWGKSDSLGLYSIDSIDIGRFVVEIRDKDSGAAALEFSNVTLKDSIVLPSVTLKPTGSIHGKLDRMIIADTVKVYVLVYGLDIYQRIGESGSFCITGIPEGIFDLKVLYSVNEYLPREWARLEVKADDTTEVGMLFALPPMDSTGMDVSAVITDSLLTPATIQSSVILIMVRKPLPYFWSSRESPNEILCENIFTQVFSPFPVSYNYSYATAIEKIGRTSFRITWPDIDLRDMIPDTYILAVTIYRNKRSEFAQVSDVRDARRNMLLSITNPWAIYVK